MNVNVNAELWRLTLRAGCFTSLRLEKTHQSGWFFWLLGDKQMFPLCFSSGSWRENKEGKKMPASHFCWQHKTRDQQRVRSALCLFWLPWKHISVCCRRRCHRNCFHFILMACNVRESINKIQVGGTWLCLRTGNSSFSCSQIALTLCSFLIGLLILQ